MEQNGLAAGDGVVDLGRAVGEGGTCARGKETDAANAGDHDHGKHHGIFNRGGTIFRREELA